MTAATRFAPGIPAAALLLSLALGLALNLAVTSAVFADPMSRDIDFRNSLSSQGGTNRDTATRDAIARDTRKKDDGLKKFSGSK